MNEHPPLQLLNSRRRAALSDAARARALELRRKAQDDFWSNLRGRIGPVIHRVMDRLIQRPPGHLARPAAPDRHASGPGHVCRC